MLSAGAKGWIKKYFNLIDLQEINLPKYLTVPDDVSEEEYIHAVLGRTGINYGFASRLLYLDKDLQKKWTSEEKLKVLLFEALLFLYLLKNKELNEQDFLQKLIEFYGEKTKKSLFQKITSFSKASTNDIVEAQFAARVDIKANYLENSMWVNYLSNVLIYLDVVQFQNFLNGKTENAYLQRESLAMEVMKTIALTAYSDKKIEKKERELFKVFLASAHLSDENRAQAKVWFEEGVLAKQQNFSTLESQLLKRYLIDLAGLVILTNHEATEQERAFLENFSEKLGFTDKELDESLLLTEQFIITNQEKIPFLHNSGSMEIVYSSLSKRWVKILGRNKDKLVVELQQSKELVHLIRKSTTTELSKEEKEMVKTQFKDIVKSMPSLAIFMLPGGSLLLPFILKIIPDLIPSAFRDNEVSDEKNSTH
ncbi:MAG: LETM1-related biofilm-associated protein [Bacteroidota bacterium]